MKILVCGGRRYQDKDRVFQVLDELHKETPITLLIHGGALGADFLAGYWAEQRGIPTSVHPAKWKRYAKYAGPLRNKEMLKMKPKLVVAFPGGRGTAHMLREAILAGIQVLQYGGEYPH